MARKLYDRGGEGAEKVSKERMHTIIDMMRRGLFQEQRTATGEVIRSHRGRKLDTVEQLDQAIADYLEYMDNINASRGAGEKPYICTLVGFCAFCGWSRQALHARMQISNDKEWVDRIKRFETLILSNLQQMGLNGELSTIPLMAELNNNHGYTNAPQVVRHEVVSELPSISDIAKRLPGSGGDDIM